jgi:hypothetical protein
MKDVKQTQIKTPQTEAKKEAKKARGPRTGPVPNTIAFFIVAVATEKRHADKAAIGDEVFKKMKALGRNVNGKGKPLEQAKCVTQTSAVFRDITTKRKGWWSLYTLDEDKEKGILLKKIGA